MEGNEGKFHQMQLKRQVSMGVIDSVSSLVASPPPGSPPWLHQVPPSRSCSTQACDSLVIGLSPAMPGVGLSPTGSPALSSTYLGTQQVLGK